MAPSRAMRASTCIGQIFQDSAITSTACQKMASMHIARQRTQLIPSSTGANVGGMLRMPIQSRAVLSSRRGLATAATSTPISQAVSTIPPPSVEPKTNISTAPETILSANAKPTRSSSTRKTRAAPPSKTKQQQQPPTHIGRVTRAGYNPHTVQVTRRTIRYDGYLRKTFRSHTRCLIHDPDNILVEGDVVEYRLFDLAEYERRRDVEGMGKSKRNVLVRVISPFGVPVEERKKKGGKDEEKTSQDLRKDNMLAGDARKRVPLEKEAELLDKAESLRQAEDEDDVVERLVGRAGKNNNKAKKSFAEQTEREERVMEVLEREEGIGEAEVERRVKQAGL